MLKNMFIVWLGSAVLFLLVVAASGCSTVRGFGQDLYQASAWVESALRKNDQPQTDLRLIGHQRNPYID